MGQAGTAPESGGILSKTPQEAISPDSKGNAALSLQQGDRIHPLQANQGEKSQI